MFDMKQFYSAIKQISEEKGISEESVFETIEAAVAAAYKREYGKKGQIVRAKIDKESGAVDINQVHFVVEGVDDDGNITGPLPTKVMEDKADFQDLEGQRRKRFHEEVKEVKPEDIKIKFNSEKHILLSDAKEKQSEVSVGDEIITRLEPKTDFGRIAAQTAKQVVIQRIREAERGAILSEFKGREGEIVSGTVQRKEGSLVFIDLGRTTGILPPIEQARGDNYRIGQRYRFVILKVEESNRGPAVILSRSSSELVIGLFKVEVPEIDAGAVQIKAIAREAGSRTKIAVYSEDQAVDPIGSLVGQKGVRVQTVINELAGEKIDIISWSPDEKEFISQAFSPAKVLLVEVLDATTRHCLVEVSEDQFSLAIGKGGQNVRLAAKLTGWRIDVRSPKESISFTEADPALATKEVENKETPTDENQS